MIYQLNNNIIVPNKWPWGYEDSQKKYAAPVPLYYRSPLRAGTAHTIGIRAADGAVLAVGLNSYQNVDEARTWTDIVAVDADFHVSAGLKSDGTVIAYGNDFRNSEYNEALSGWTDVVMIAIGTTRFLLGLKSDGTVVGTGADEYSCVSGTSGWTDIIQIDAGEDYSLGLKSNGTVVGCGLDGDGQVSDTATWADIVQISCGELHALGLKSDGTVVGAGADAYSCVSGTSGWTDIIQINVGDSFSLGLKSDGTVVGCGLDGDGQVYYTAAWTNVIYISCGKDYSMGLRPDGLVVAAGADSFYSNSPSPPKASPVSGIYRYNQVESLSDDTGWVVRVPDTLRYPTQHPRPSPPLPTAHLDDYPG